MSGICAVWRKENPAATARTVRTLCAGLQLHSSEQASSETSQNVGIAVSARFAGQQFYSDQDVMVACDADLYNEHDLRAWLGGAAEPRRGTAALAAALYRRCGNDFVERLRGGFAVILWDRRERRLLFAIDGFGIKRLAYADTPSGLFIASRITGLLQTGEVARDINAPAIPTVLNFSANLGPATVFKAISRVPPGTSICAGDRGLESRKYWDMSYNLSGRGNETELARGLEAAVEESVSVHSGAEDPDAVGAFLSGGTDSSTILGMMTRIHRRPVHAFSIGFQEQEFDELEYAKIAARKFQSLHHTYRVSAQDCFEALPAIVRSFDEPFGNSSAIPTYFCAKLAAESGVRKLLAGDGGDELFAGNEWYLTDKVFEAYGRVPRILRKGLIEPLLAAAPFDVGLVRRGRGYIRRANMAPVQRILSFQFLMTHSPSDVFEGDFLRELGDYSICDIPSRHYAAAVARDHLDRLLYMDMKITLADSDLPKVTCMAELAGITARFPFLDRSVAAFSGRIPACLKVKRAQKRYLFKQAFRNLLPVETIQKKKHGFGIPVATWLKSDARMRELAHDVLLSARAFERGYFRRQFIEDLFQKHETEDSSYYGDTLWTFLALELWHRQHVDECVGAPA